MTTTYTNIARASKIVLAILILLVFQPISATCLSPANADMVCTYTVRETVKENLIVVDIRLTTSSRLPSPQTLRVSVAGENGVVVVEIVKPLSKVYCSFERDKLVLVVGNTLREYSVKALGDKIVSIHPAKESTVAVNVDVETENAIEYALSSLRLVDALLYGYSINVKGNLLSISCSSEHNTSIFQIFYNGIVRDPLDIKLEIENNTLFYHYSGPPLPSLKDLLDILERRCENTIKPTIDARNWPKTDYVGVEEPLLPLPAGLTILLDSILPIPSLEKLSTNKSDKPISTTPELVEAIKQAYRKLVDIAESFDKNRSFKQQTIASLGGEKDEDRKGLETTLTRPSKTMQDGIDISLLLFPLAFAAIAYIVWREHKI